VSRGLLVGYDGSACAQVALARALELARELDQPVLVAFGFRANPVGGELDDYRTALREHARGVLASASELGRAEGVPVETLIAEEAPAEALADIARERDVRAIVVGTHGEAPWRGALVGSTPHKLLQLADRPVLVVPAHEARGARQG
jgi:nucleotide-binding universal stress UspA family protein